MSDDSYTMHKAYVTFEMKIGDTEISLTGPTEWVDMWARTFIVEFDPEPDVSA